MYVHTQWEGGLTVGHPSLHHILKSLSHNPKPLPHYITLQYAPPHLFPLLHSYFPLFISHPPPPPHSPFHPLPSPPLLLPPFPFSTLPLLASPPILLPLPHLPFPSSSIPFPPSLPSPLNKLTAVPESGSSSGTQKSHRRERN